MVLLYIYTIIQLYPLIWLLLFSLKDNNEIFGGNVLGLPHNWLWSNYSTALTSGKVGIYFLNSLLITSVTIVFSSILISMAAFAIIRMKWKLSKVVLNVFLLGMMVPLHATLLPLFIVLQKMNLLDTRLALILPYTVFAIPMGILVSTGLLQSIPRELEEAACLDGCSIYKVFYYIILPLMRPALSTIAIFTYLHSWNELMFANTFINSDEIKTLTVGIMSLAGEFTTNWGPIGAGLVIATLPTLLVYFILSDQVQKSFISGAVKG
ncbi:MAG TPA: carbohydrate ABC transporter permease [Ruminiclostridium sp.]